MRLRLDRAAAEKIFERGDLWVFVGLIVSGLLFTLFPHWRGLWVVLAMVVIAAAGRAIEDHAREALGRAAMREPGAGEAVGSLEALRACGYLLKMLFGGAVFGCMFSLMFSR